MSGDRVCGCARRRGYDVPARIERISDGSEVYEYGKREGETRDQPHV